MPCRVRATLHWFDDVDIIRAPHWLKDSPTELAASIGCLELVLPDDGTDHNAALSALTEVLALCGNIDTLRIYSDSYFDLEDFASQLLLWNPHGLPNMHAIRFPGRGSCPPHVVLQMLKMMPNLRVCERLPQIPTQRAPRRFGRLFSGTKLSAVSRLFVPPKTARKGPAEASNKRLDATELASFDGTIRTRTLYVTSQDAEVAVPLLLSGRWVTHTAVFYVRPRLLHALTDYDGPRCETVDLVDLTLHLLEGGSAVPLAAWLARTCRAMQRLHVFAAGAEMPLILESLLPHGAFRLRELHIEHSIRDDATAEKQVKRLAALLLSAPPCLATLRVLRIGFSAHTQLLYGPFLRDVALFCRERRIVYSLKDNAYAAALGHWGI